MNTHEQATMLALASAMKEAEDQRDALLETLEQFRLEIQRQRGLMVMLRQSLQDYHNNCQCAGSENTHFNASQALKYTEKP